MTEFFNQGDREREKGLPVSMFMDRQTTVVGKCQVGFIDYIVMPLFEIWDTYMNEEGEFPALENLKNNREYWKNLQ
jgi:3'5'-cyclic nucleotide phosphodiesterase